MTRVACAVLAAGASRRLGYPKQLLIHRGKPLVLNAADHVCQTAASARAVVVGASGELVRAALGNCPVEILENDEWAEGMASSIRLAAAWAETRECDALLLLLCDQPKLSAEHLNRLIVGHERSQLPAASFYAGKCAVPALFPRSHFPDLRALRGDTGATRLLNGGQPVTRVPWPDGEFDVDAPEAERRLLEHDPVTPAPEARSLPVRSS